MRSDGRATRTAGSSGLDLGDRVRAEADFAAVISSPDASDESRACCLNNRADLRVNEGDHLGAIVDRTAVLQLRETSYNRRYIALVRRAKSLWALQRFEEANEDVEAILSTTDIAVEQKMAARLMRAEWAAGMGIPVIVEAELNQVMASRRNFPAVTKAATALAGDLGMLDGLAASAPGIDDDGKRARVDRRASAPGVLQSEGAVRPDGARWWQGIPPSGGPRRLPEFPPIRGTLRLWSSLDRRGCCVTAPA